MKMLDFKVKRFVGIIFHLTKVSQVIIHKRDLT